MSGLKNAISKYFIALVPSGQAFEELEAIKRAIFERYKIKGALRSPAHITLHRPFEWQSQKEDILLERLQKFEFGNPLSVAVRNYSWFEPRVIFADIVKNAELEQLHQRLGRHCQRELKLLNEINDMRGFHPHITLAFRDLKKPQFYALKAEFESKTLNIDLHFEHMSLLKMHERWEVCKTF